MNNNLYYILLIFFSLISICYYMFMITAKVIQYSKKFNSLPEFSLTFIDYVFNTTRAKVCAFILLLTFVASLVFISKHISRDVFQFILFIFIGYCIGINVGYRFYVNNKKFNLNASMQDKRKYYICNILFILLIVSTKFFN